MHTVCIVSKHAPRYECMSTFDKKTAETASVDLLSVVINLSTRLPLDLRALQNVVRLCQDADLAQASTVFRT